MSECKGHLKNGVVDFEPNIFVNNENKIYAEKYKSFREVESHDSTSRAVTLSRASMRRTRYEGRILGLDKKIDDPSFERNSKKMYEQLMSQGASPKYRETSIKLLRSAMGKYQITEPTNDQWLILLNKLESSPGVNGNTRLSNATKIAYHVMMRKWAEALEYTPENGYKAIKPYGPQIVKRQKSRISRQDFENLILACGKNDRNIAMLYLLYYTGIRPKECRACWISDVSLENNEFHVRDHGEGIKVARERTIDIHPELRRVLRQWLQIRDELRIGSVFKSPYLFPSEDDEMIKEKSFARTLEWLKKKAGIDHQLGLYNFRHTFISNMYDEGFQTPDIMIYAGHKKGSTTEGYRIPNRENMRNRFVNMKF